MKTDELKQRETIQYNTAERSQPRPAMAASMHRGMAREQVINKICLHTIPYTCLFEGVGGYQGILSTAASETEIQKAALVKSLLQ